MNVVNSAMITIMENSAGEITPISKPMLRMTNSIRPRVFISVPSPAASRSGMPLSQEARVDPPSLPTVATKMIRPQYIHICGPFTSPMLVRKSGESKEQRQQERHCDGLEAVEHVAHEVMLFRHDGAHQECAEQQVDPEIFTCTSDDAERAAASTPSDSR